VKLRYTLRGAAELDKILVTIAQQSPQGARRVQRRIQAIISLLLQHPHAGRLTSKGRLRRLATTRYPYLIFYCATDDEVVIHGVRHSARDPSSMPR
jgi:plasmid stabilization system protein ParE